MNKILCKIREQVRSHLGEAVKVRSSKGRRKVEEKKGIIKAIYPRLFTVYIQDYERVVSFSYAELLTKEVEVELLTTNQKLW